MDLFKTRQTTPEAPKRTSKGANAYLSISEVATELGVATHVLRFWESKFPTQITPKKQAGGRRFYSPSDITTLRHIQTLLHDEGYTIKGVQSLFSKQKKLASGKKKGAPLTPQNIVLELKSIRAQLAE